MEFANRLNSRAASAFMGLIITVTAVIKMISANPNREASSEPLRQSAQILHR